MIYGEIEINRKAHDQGFGLDSTLYQSIGATASDAFTRSAGPSGIRSIELSIADGEIPIPPNPFSLFLNPLKFDPGFKKLTEQEYKDSEFFREGVKFPNGVNEEVARITAERKDKENQNRFVIENAPKGFGTTATLFTTSILTSLLDPVNVASAFIPVVGQVRYAKMVSRIGTTPARIVRGAVEGAVGAAVVEPLVFAAAKQEQADYGMYDSLMAVGFGAVFGSVLHAGAGKVGDVMRKYSEKLDETSLRTATAQMIEGRDVKVDGFYRAGEIENIKTSRDVDLEFNDIYGPRPIESLEITELKTSLSDIDVKILKAKSKVKKSDSARRNKQAQSELDSLVKEKSDLGKRISAVDKDLVLIKTLEDKKAKIEATDPKSKKGKESKAKKLEKVNKEIDEVTERVRPKEYESQSLRKEVKQALENSDNAPDAQSKAAYKKEADDIISRERGFERYESDAQAIKDNTTQDSSINKEEAEAYAKLVVTEDVDINAQILELEAEVTAIKETGIVDDILLKEYEDASKLVENAKDSKKIIKALDACEA